MEKINWQNGTVVKEASVTIDGTEYQVIPREIEGTTPLSASNLNLMQDNIEDAIQEVDDKIEQDTGWVKINTSVTNDLYYRKKGTFCYIRGTVNHSSSVQQITLPFSADNQYVFLLAGSALYYTKAYINANNILGISIGTATSTSNTYIINISFFTSE